VPLLGIVTGTSMHDDARFGGVIGTRDVVVARVMNGGASLAVEPALRREQFTFAHEGVVADVALLRRRISPKRALQIGSDAHAESLFAYLLSHLDSAEGTDAALSRAVADIARSGLRGSFNFILSTADAMYVHCHMPPIGFIERPSALIVSSHSFTSEPLQPLSSGALLRVDRGAVVTWRLISGDIDSSGPEMPFTD
jgi:hypothetical protein